MTLATGKQYAEANADWTERIWQEQQLLLQANCCVAMALL